MFLYLKKAQQVILIITFISFSLSEPNVIPPAPIQPLTEHYGYMNTGNCQHFIKYHVLPDTWPCEWYDQKIPYALNFYTSSPKRLMGLVSKGLEFLQQRSCLEFEEEDPVKLANHVNLTYLYFTFSGVLENCCLPFYENPVGRRTVMITPTCSLPAGVAHATLHALGLKHAAREAFEETSVKDLLFYIMCENSESKYNLFLARQILFQ